MTGKVAIVGGGPSSEMLAPFADASWQIWVLGNRSNKYPRIDRVFEIHDNRSEHKQPEYDQYLIAQGIRMVVGETFPIPDDCPHITRYPYEHAANLLGQTYLTSSPAYMVAMAILEGYDHIGLWGVDMAVDDHEYFYQRPCMEAWVGYAKGLGITVEIPPQSPLFKSTYIEGRHHNNEPEGLFTEQQFKALAKGHADRIEQLKAQIAELERSVQAHNGAMQAYERMGAVARAIEGGQDIKKLSDGVRLI